LLIDIRPLRRNAAFRLLFASQFVSALGTMVSYVAVPWQVYQLTHSNAQVGLLGLIQLVPVIVCGLLGGTVADRVDRKRLLIGSEGLMAACLAGLLANTVAASPSLLAIYVLVAVLQGASGFHRPALEALTQKLARRDEYAAVAALSSIRGTFGMVVGPAIAGLLLAGGGAAGAYLFDFVTFIVALLLLARIPRAQVEAPASRQRRSSTDKPNASSAPISLCAPRETHVLSPPPSTMSEALTATAVAGLAAGMPSMVTRPAPINSAACCRERARPRRTSSASTRARRVTCG